MPNRSWSTRALVLAAMLISPIQSRADTYLLGIQDRLRISVYDWPNINGEYAVGLDGNIALPFVGDVSAAGVSRGELADTISDRLKSQAHLSDRPVTTVEILQYRPVYILGDVPNPGEYPYRADLTVLQTLSIAGGLLRARDAGLFQIERDGLTARGEVQGLTTQVLALLAQRARLEAEVEGKEDITFPPDLSRASNDPQIAQVMRDQEAVLASRRVDLDARLKSLNALRTLYQREIVTLQAQSETEGRQLAAAQREVAAMQGLLQKGMTSLPKSLEYERAAADIEGKMHELEAAAIRAEQNINQTDEKIGSLVSARRLDVLAQLSDVRERIKDVLHKRTTAQELASESANVAPLVRNRDNAQTTFAIVRQETGGPQERPAAEDTRVQPGDVVKVLQGSGTEGASMPPLPFSATASVSAP